MPIRKPVNQMSPDELRAFVTEHRQKQLDRGQKAAAKRKANGLVRVTVYVPEGARERVHKAIAREVREYKKETRLPFDEPEEDQS